MKKKILVVVLAIASCLMLAFGLSACASKAPDTTPHTHNYQWVDNGDGTHDGRCSAVDCDKPDVNSETHIWGANNKCTKCLAVKPVDEHTHRWSTSWANDDTHHWHNCTTNGCTVTDNILKDGYATHDFTNGNCVCGKEKPQHSHKWSTTWEKSTTHHWHNCTASGCAVTDNTQKNGYAEHIAGAAATTTTPQTCTVCGYVIAEPIGHTHSTTLVPTKSASCTESGNIAYYTCTCGKYFSDKAGKIEIGLDDTVINKIGHDWEAEWTVDVEATTEHMGSKSHHCSRCDEKTDVTDIPRLTVATYNVIFNANGGKIDGKDTKTVTGTVNQKINSPTDPKRTDYTFTGWYKDGATTTLWNFDTDVITGATTLYAGWKQNIPEYDVTFVLNYLYAQQTVKSTENGLITYIPQRTGYIFNGWWYSDGQTADGSYILTDKFDTSKRVTQSGLTLYAEWVQERTSDSQLYSPSVSISENGVFSWMAISNAKGYKVEVYSGTNKVTEQSLTTTSWTFPNSMTAGYYTVKIRANGDGETTVNSAWTEKYYSFHMLGAANIQFNNATSILTWDAVKNAAAYEVRINGTLKTTITYTTYDLSELDAGDYTVSVTPTREGWASSATTNHSISKKRLKTPIVTVTEKNDCTYIVSWSAVSHADTYRIKHHDTYITITDTSYIVSNDSAIFNNSGIGEFTVVAFDSNADYFISNDSEHFEVKKIYPITLNKSDNAAGVVSSAKYNYKVGESVTISASTNKGYTWLGWYDGDREITKESSYLFNMSNEAKSYTAKWTYYTLTLNKTEGGNVSGSGSSTGIIEIDDDSEYTVNFNTNGGSQTIVSQIITKNVGLVYPAIPTRVGYVFAGWYSNSACTGNVYDFSAEVNANKTLYAKWLSYSGNGVIDYNGSKTVNIVSKNSSTDYYAFVPLVSGSVSIYSANGLSDTYGYLYNSSKTQITYDDDSGNGSNFKITYNLIAGTLYYIRPCGYSGSGTTTVYVSGEEPLAGGKSGQRRETVSTANQAVTISAETDSGYTFIGWYDGNTKLSSNLDYTFTMPNNNVSYTAKWCRVIVESNDNNAGIVSTLTGTYKVGDSITITASNNLGYTFIGWYDGNTKLSDKLSFTFVMPSENATYTANWQVNDDLSNFTFTSTIDSLTITDVIDKTVTSITIPNSVTSIGNNTFNGCNSLTSITLPNGITYIGENVFNGCSSLTSITIPDTVTSIWSYAFSGCSSLTSITIPSSVTYIGDGAFSGCSSLTSVTIPQSLTSLYLNSFNGCSNLTNITYTGDIENWCKISGLSGLMQANYNDKTLIINGKEVTGNFNIPSGMTSIPNYAFCYCNGLTSISIPDSVTSIGDNVFNGCNKLTNITVSANNKNYASQDGILYNKTKTQIIYVPKAISGAVTIPSSVTSIPSYKFSNCIGLTSITIPGSVEIIGYSAFSYCSELTNVTIAYGVTDIEYNAFYNCTSLTSITIPNSVTSIQSSFENCPIETATIPSIAASYIKNSELKSVVITSGTSIESYAFYECSSLTNITIPSSVTSVGNDAFYRCSSLTSITYNGDIKSWCQIDGLSSLMAWSSNKTLIINSKEITGSLIIPSGVTTISSSAFRSCNSLTNVTIPSSVTSIGSYAFYYCTSITSISIPNSVTSIGNSAFKGCSGIVSVSLGSGITNIGDSTFSECNSLTSITIPNGVTSIGTWAFEDCSSLTSVTIPSSLTSIGSQAFRGCNSISSITYTGNIKDWCGYNLTGLMGMGGPNNRTLIINGEEVKGELVIPSGVTSIGSSAFENCSSVTSITIPNSVTSIGNSAFEGCSSLTSITIPNSVTSIGYDAFKGCSGLTSITIPDSVTSIDTCAFQDCSSLTTIKIGNGVTCINNDTFNGCSSLTSVTIGNGLTDIRNRAFLNCSSLQSITIPSGVTNIGTQAFYGCTKLVSITIPNSVTSIGKDSFTNTAYYNNASNWENGVLYINNHLIKADTSISGSYTIKTGTLSIAAYAFSGCSSLTSVTIPTSVISINEYAFGSCSSLTRVTFANPSGWWYAGSVWATSGTSIPSSDLSNATTAATCLKTSYIYFILKRI